VTPRVLASDLGFVEGPVWTADERLLVTSVDRGVLFEVDLDGGGMVRELAVGGGPNGLAEDGDGRLWVAQNGLFGAPTGPHRQAAPGLQRLAGETVDDVVTSGCLAPNDLVQGPDGQIWFTDPGEWDADLPGRVAVADPETGAVRTVHEGLRYPNGLAFGPGGELLYVAESRTGRVVEFERAGDELRLLRTVATLAAGGDGMAFSDDGRLFVAVPEAEEVSIILPDGSLGDPIRFDGVANPTNVCFAGPRRDVLVVTAAEGGRVVAFDGVATGAPVIR
jgi:gluconolactonase